MKQIILGVIASPVYALCGLGFGIGLYMPLWSLSQTAIMGGCIMCAVGVTWDLAEHVDS
jgi:putative Mn2+ efflux pump MntP